jgi:hypothetical protein
LVFYTGTATFSFKQLHIYPHESEWIPFYTYYFSENLVTLGIEHGTSGCMARSCGHWTTEAVALRL